MRDTYEAEEIILAMAQIVKENRALRREVNELRLREAKHDAYMRSLTNKTAEKEYEILCDIERNNLSCNVVRSNGWLSNQDYIDDWEAEFERRMKEGA